MKIICNNKKANFEYFILDSFEAGIVLSGCEVKSVVKGHISINESFCLIRKGEVWLKNCYIKPYEFGNIWNKDERRDRKLLLHKHEIDKIYGKIKKTGLALLPKQVYLKNNKVKIEIVIGKGKKLYDKKRIKKERDIKKAVQKAIKNYR